MPPSSPSPSSSSSSSSSAQVLRILFFGTPEIAAPTLENLIAGPHDVIGVVSQPDRARGRGRRESPSPISAIALRENIPLFRPERVGVGETIESLRELRPDLGVVVAFGQFLPKQIREMPSRGYLINAHASLLPKYRGASPIAQAILDGETETGVSVMRVDKEMDAGPVALVRRIAIEAQENTAELSLRLAELAGLAIEVAVDRVAKNEIEWTEQDASRATIAPKLEKSDSRLDLRESAVSLACRVHALSPKPGGALTLVSDRDEKFERVAVKISRATVMPFTSVSAGPGDRLVQSNSKAMPPVAGMIDRHCDDVVFRIATGEGWLVPVVMQRAGGKPLATADFLRGFTMPDDVRCEISDCDVNAKARAKP
jgi:methionyl-tRNA formyltransferase